MKTLTFDAGGRVTRLKSVSKYLKYSPLPSSTRGKVRAILRDMVAKQLPHLVDKNPFSGSRFNDAVRHLLHQAVFTVENEIESRGNGHPHDPRVVSLGTIRNRLYDELGINDLVGTEKGFRKHRQRPSAGRPSPVVG